MANIQKHLRNTLLAGAFAVAPVALTIYLIIKVDEWTRGISEAVFGKGIPFVGVVIAVVAVYLTGVFVTHSLGKWLLRTADSILGKIPIIKPLYDSWKQISLTPGGGEGMFAKVVLVPDPENGFRQMGFTSGDPLPDDPESICVFVPNAPNPIQGRLFILPRAKVVFTSLSSEEAFKFLLSTGNYCPPLAGCAAAA